MKKTVIPGERSGSASVPSSKSHIHRLLICAALSDSDSRTELVCDGISKDVEATISCLNSLGAAISVDNNIISASGIKKTKPCKKHLYCQESGSTLRFLIPVVGALGETAVFHMEGRLPERPLGPLLDVLSENGMEFDKDGDKLICTGKLKSGIFKIKGNVSSQFISGLLFALPLLSADSVISISGEPESLPYIRMTEKVLLQSGIEIRRASHIGDGLIIFAPQKYKVAPKTFPEADWSSAAFLLSIGAFSKKGVRVNGMTNDSIQGDRAIIDILNEFGANVNVTDEFTEVKRKALKGITVDAREIPDLVPVISAVASGAEGETKIINASRLRLKESDRLKTTAAALSALGADIKETNDGLVITGKESLDGGKVNSFNDHRIAMTAAVAACICKNKVTITDAECTNKSFPGFWETFEALEVIK